MAGKKPEDGYVRELEEALTEAKRNREWRHEYMTLLMRDQENIEKGIEKGIAKGRIYGAISMCRDLGLSDEEIIIKLCEKFCLSEEEVKELLYEEYYE